MKTVNTLLSQLTAIDVSSVIYEALAQTEQDYIDRQKQQMLAGYNSIGSRIGVYANPAYKAKKMILNPSAGGYVDLRLTGAFQSGIFAATDNEGFRVGSADEKANMLQDRYGDSIFTLAPVNRSAFIAATLYPTTLRIIESSLK